MISQLDEFLEQVYAKRKKIKEVIVLSLCLMADAASLCRE